MLLNVGVHKPRVEVGYVWWNKSTASKYRRGSPQMSISQRLRGNPEDVRRRQTVFTQGPSSISFLYWSLYRTVKSTSFFFLLRMRHSWQREQVVTTNTITQTPQQHNSQWAIYNRERISIWIRLGSTESNLEAGCYVVSPVWWKSQSHIRSTMLFLDSASTDLLLCAVLYCYHA